MMDTQYRWEYKNRGLDHKCATCKHNLCSPRAKRTCFGTHEEVCIRYHKTLFFIGGSHKCEACHRSIELHDKRHREIGGLRNALLQLSGKYANDPLTAVELEKIHNAVHGSPCRGNTTNLVKTKSADSSKFDAKQKKTASKNGNSRSSCIPVEDDARIPAIIRRLGISDGDVSPDNKNKKFHSVLTQLRHAIALDLVSVENEEREIMMRMAGYWRYVNRRTYNAMVRNNQLWDWATGEKLDELDVSGSDDGDDDPNEGQDDERADNGPRKRGKKGKSGSGGRRR